MDMTAVLQKPYYIQTRIHGRGSQGFGLILASISITSQTEKSSVLFHCIAGHSPEAYRLLCTSRPDFFLFFDCGVNNITIVEIVPISTASFDDIWVTSSVSHTVVPSSNNSTANFKTALLLPQ